MSIHDKPIDSAAGQSIQKSDQNLIKRFFSHLFGVSPTVKKTSQREILTKLQQSPIQSQQPSLDLITKSPDAGGQAILKATASAAQQAQGAIAGALSKEAGFGRIDSHVVISNPNDPKVEIAGGIALDQTHNLDPDAKVILTSHEKPQAPPADARKKISYEHKVDGKSYGSEVVDRIDTVQTAIKSLTLQSAALNDKLETINDHMALLLSTNEPDQNLIAKAQKDFELVKKELEICNKALDGMCDPKMVDKGWCDSNYFRDALGKSKDPASFTKANEATIPVAPINLRYQKVVPSPGSNISSTKEGSGFARLGVISDLRNGFTNIQELKEMAKEGEKPKLESKKKELESLKAKYEKNKEPVKAASVDYAIKQLENIENTIVEREFILKQQMLQLIQVQANENPAAIEAGKFSLTHLLLLNPKTNKVDKTGWCHNEANEIKDMEEAFDMMKGKTISFVDDGNTPPHFDENGNIVMARPLGVGDAIKEIAIQDAFIMNNSPQGHMKNDGLQKQINDKNILRLKTAIQDQPDGPGKTEALSKLSELEKRYKGGESSYKTAVLLQEILILAKLPHSVGCLSAKDRTGVVCANGSCFALASRDTGVMSRLKENILNPDGCATQIVADNTRALYLKVSTLGIPGITDTIKGCIYRLGYFKKQIGGALGA